MKFAVNYSTAAKELLKKKKIDVDLFKCPDWAPVINAASALRPVYIHFDIGVGLGQVDHLDQGQILDLVQRTATPHLNCHLNAPANYSPQNTSDRIHLRDTWLKELEALHSLAGDLPIAAENLPLQPYRSGFNISADPELIDSVIRQSGCELLLDLSHARITAFNLGISAEEYIRGLPTDLLRELHITGLKFYHGFLQDHFELTDEDFAYAAWAQAQIIQGAWRTPEIVALEYGGVGEVFGWRTDKAQLLEQVPRLMDMFGSKSHQVTPIHQPSLE